MSFLDGACYCFVIFLLLSSWIYSCLTCASALASDVTMDKCTKNCRQMSTKMPSTQNQTFPKITFTDIVFIKTNTNKCDIFPCFARSVCFAWWVGRFRLTIDAKRPNLLLFAYKLQRCAAAYELPVSIVLCKFSYCFPNVLVLVILPFLH